MTEEFMPEENVRMNNLYIVMYHYTRNLKYSRHPNIKGLDYALFREQIAFLKQDLIISEQTCADDIDEWDSLQHINLIAMLEREFNIEFDIDEIISMENVGDLSLIHI